MGYTGDRADEKLRPLQLRRRDDGLYLNAESFPHRHDFSMSWLVMNQGDQLSFEVEQQPDAVEQENGKGIVHLSLCNASATYEVVVPWKNPSVALWEGTLVSEETTGG